MKHHNRWQVWLILLLLCSLLPIHYTPVAAATTALAPADEAALTAALQTLSTEGWVDAAVQTGNRIFAKPQYTATDWQNFFTTYFRTNPLNNRLWDYLGYPVFAWLGAEVNTKLQTALKQPLLMIAEQSFTELDALGAAAWDAALAADVNKRESFFNSLRRLLELAQKNDSTVERDSYYSWLKGLINRYPAYLKQPADLGNNYILANLRLFVTVGMYVISPEPLTATRKNEIEQTAGFTGLYRTIWRRHQVIIGDNNGATAQHLTVIEAYFSKLPPGLHNMQILTIGDNADRPDSRNFGPIGHNLGVLGRGVNIWVGAYRENEWPTAEVPAHEAMGTLILMAHEVGHRLDPDYLPLHPDLQARRPVLLAMAGCDAINYLRNDCGIQEAPQEFLAGLMNFYGTYTINALRLAMKRLQVDHTPQPLNQFLYLAEIYAQGSNRVPFYDSTGEGKVIRYDVPAARDQYGHLNQLTVDGQRFAFVLDADGNVQSATVTPLPRLTGAVIGTTGSWENHGNTRAKCFDGDPNSFFDAPRAQGWCGLAFNSAQTVSYVRFIARTDFRDRMIGGKFQGSNVANFSSGVVTLHTITTKPHEGWNWAPLPTAAAFRYWRYLSPNGGWGNVGEVEFYHDGVVASALTDDESAMEDVGDRPEADPGASEPDAVAPAGSNRLFLPLVTQMDSQ